MDPRAKKTALRMIVTGLYVLSTRDGDDVVASTISWLSQSSFEPPMVMAAIKVDSRTHQVVERAGHFAINMLAADQRAMAQTFFKSVLYADGRLGGYAVEAGPADDPLFVDSPAWFACRVVEWVHKGDHSVVVAEVVDAGVRRADAQSMALRDTPWEYGG